MMKSVRFVLPAVLICLCSSVSAGGERRYTIENTRYMTLHSEQTGHDHELIVFLPYSYESGSDKRYPVLYFMDAYWDMPLLAAIYGQLMYDNLAPEFMMVGMSYPGEEPQHDVQRRRDLSPTESDAYDTPTGGAGRFLGFLKQDVVSRVESKYRASGQRALAGVSMGGLFALFAMYEDPGFFGRYIAISPAVGWGDNGMIGVDNRYAREHDTLNARLFVSHGSEEYVRFRRPIIDFQEQIENREYHGLALLNHRIAGARHVTGKGEGYTRGLIWVWKDIAPAEPGGLEQSMRARAGRPRSNPSAN